MLIFLLEHRAAELVSGLRRVHRDARPRQRPRLRAHASGCLIGHLPQGSWAATWCIASIRLIQVRVMSISHRAFLLACLELPGMPVYAVSCVP